MTRDELAEAWRTNHRINVLLMESIDDAGMACTLSRRGGRDVARQFAHLHDVRRYFLENRTKDLAEGLRKFASKASPSRAELLEAHEASTARIETSLLDLFDGAPGRRGFRKGLFTTLSYLVAHESHHRGSILLTLKQSGHAVPKDVAYGIWGWDQR